MTKLKTIADNTNEKFINTGKLVFASSPFFHALRGGEHTSGFYRKTRLVVWEASKSFAINTESFLCVIYNVFSIFVEKSWQIKMIERFIIAL